MRSAGGGATATVFHPRTLAVIVLVALAYAATALIGLRYSVVPGAGTSVWPAAGIAYAALALGGIRLWPAVVLGRLLTAFIVDSPTPWWGDLMIAVATTAGAVIPVWIARRQGANDPSLGTAVSMAYLVIGGVVGGALISASLGCLALYLGGTPVPQLLPAWENWASGFAVGVLVFAPLILTWSRPAAWRQHRVSWLHLSLCLASVAALAAFMFLRPEDTMIRTWHLLPLLVWAALAFNVRGVSAALVIVSVLAIVGAADALGPLASAGLDPTGRVLLTQQFIALTGVTMLFLAAIAEERRNVLDRARLAAIVTNSPEAILTTDIEGRITSWNTGAEALFGWTADEVTGRSVIDTIVPEADRPQSAERLARVLAGETVRFEDRRLARNGEEIEVGITSAPLRAPNGQPIGFFSLLRDIRKRKAAERGLRLLNEELELRVEQRTRELRQAEEALRQSQKLEAMGQLTGGVAHDFNNLLTPIVGSLDMLQRRGVGGERERRLIDGALQSAERAKTLVQRLLAFARRQPLQPSAVDLRTLIADMAELIASTSGPRIALAIEIEPQLPAVRADANQIEMALLNLAVNARDAMPDGGRLTVRASAEEAEAAGTSGLAPGRYVRLAVVDSGIGMSAETLARAIEPFFSTMGVGQGTGLGLSMVHGLAAQLGGTLTIDSAEGAGTTVALWLPVAEAVREAGEPADQHSAGGTAAASGTVLLVDDDELARSTAAEMLDELGLRVIEARSGDEALARLDSGLACDLVVTDHLMPGMTGAALSAALRVRRPDLKILIVTGFADAEGLPADLPRLTKPFRRAELAAALAALR